LNTLTQTKKTRALRDEALVIFCLRSHTGPTRSDRSRPRSRQHHIGKEHAAYPDHGGKDMERYEQCHTLKLPYDFGLGSELAPRRRMSAQNH
jgi:hypothetical protein